MGFQFEVVNFRPVKISVYKELTDRMEGLEEGQCIRVKVDSRHMTNQLCAGVRGALRNKFKVITQREDGFVYLYRGHDFVTHKSQ